MSMLSLNTLLKEIEPTNPSINNLFEPDEEVGLVDSDMKKISRGVFDELLQSTKGKNSAPFKNTANGATVVLCINNEDYSYSVKFTSIKSIIDYFGIDYLVKEPSKLLSLNLDIVPEIQTLLKLRSTSESHRKIVDDLLIERLNRPISESNPQKFSFKKLGLHSLKEIIDFFGNRTSDLTFLEIFADESFDLVDNISLLFWNVNHVMLAGVPFTEKLALVLNRLGCCKILDLNGCKEGKDFSSLISCLPHLKAIYLQNCHDLENIDILDLCRELEYLSITNCEKISTLSLKNSPLKNLVINNGRIKNIHVPKLIELSMTHCILEWMNCLALRRVIANDCFITDIRFLSNLMFLNNLAVNNCPIYSIYPLVTLKKLETLQFSECENVFSLEALLDCPSLKEVQIDLKTEIRTKGTAILQELDLKKVRISRVREIS